MRSETKRQIEQVNNTLETAGWQLIEADLKAQIAYLDENWYIVDPAKREKMAILR